MTIHPERVTDATHPAPHRDRVSLAALFFGILGAPAAWNLQELISASITGHICYPGAEPIAIPLWHGMWTVLLIIDIVGILIAFAALLVSIRNWHRVHEEMAGSGHVLVDIGEGRTRFMSMVGILTSSLFLLGLIFASASIFVFPLCL